MTQASFTLQGHNPDVLSCIANLSNDEVFTPPAFANQMLDSLEASWAASNNGESIWANKEVTFLDPCTKSGVFLREIVKRLNEGLSKELPDLTERINHILTKQVFGIGITELTSLLARRSVYCSKYANGIHSIARTFTNNDGNIWFERTEHTWVNGKCKFCGASNAEYARSNELETHAYAFIHTDNFKEKISKMFGGRVQFDVIIGNPPYQMNDGGGMGTSARPIYHLFVQQAKALDPKLLSMVMPSRWFSGGKGLDEFRDEMLTDKRLIKIVDFFDSEECFPGVDISGGVSYFLWSNASSSDCEVVSIQRGQMSVMKRPLLEVGADSFIRFNDAISIFRKTRGKTLEDIVSPRKPFGLRADVPIKEKSFSDSIKCYSYPKSGFIQQNEVSKNTDWLRKYKVYISKAYGERGSFPYLVIGKPFLGEKLSVCSETYLVVGPFDNKSEAENALSYLMTRFVRFLVLLRKNTQNAAKGVYSFVPVQDFSQQWTDEKLYEKYGLTNDEITFIESMIRPMEITGE
jgi:site-specific DNA-methyltransferase (adenine-specific)